MRNISRLIHSVQTWFGKNSSIRKVFVFVCVIARPIPCNVISFWMVVIVHFFILMVRTYHIWWNWEMIVKFGRNGDHYKYVILEGKKKKKTIKSFSYLDKRSFCISSFRINFFLIQFFNFFRFCLFLSRWCLLNRIPFLSCFFISIVLNV